MEITQVTGFTKVLGVEWSSYEDVFRPMVSLLATVGQYTKRGLVSNIAHLYNVLGWYCSAIIVAKILLQMLWKEGRQARVQKLEQGVLILPRPPIIITTPTILRTYTITR